MDRVSRDENRIAARIKIVASSNVNPKVQPLELQGKGNTSPKRRKKKKKGQSSASIVVDCRQFLGGGKIFAPLSIFPIRSLILRNFEFFLCGEKIAEKKSESGNKKVKGAR